MLLGCLEGSIQWLRTTHGVTTKYASFTFPLKLSEIPFSLNVSHVGVAVEYNPHIIHMTNTYCQLTLSFDSGGPNKNAGYTIFLSGH